MSVRVLAFPLDRTLYVDVEDADIFVPDLSSQ